MQQDLVIGPHRWKVSFTAKVPDGHDGYCDAEHLTIYVNAKLPSSVMKETLLHEVLHAAWRASYLPDAKDTTEEQIVSCLAIRLLEILQANPWFADYVSKP